MKSPDYESFVEKFKPKKTTDDCYTPPKVYEVIKNWVCNKYGIDEKNIIRPFWPGKDYTAEEYPPGCVVVDNPPFSISSKIYEYYVNNKIPFFLFAPALTVLSSKNTVLKLNHIICDADIIYENGAIVKTSFVTNLNNDGVIAQTAPDLQKIISLEVQKGENKPQLSKYEYPDNVITAAMLQKYSKYGIEFSVREKECAHIRMLDAQKDHKKAIYGSGLLLSEGATKRKIKAEKDIKDKNEHIKWHLSEREKKLIASLE